MKGKEGLFAGAFVALTLLLVIPIPPFLLDVLLAASLILSLHTLLMTLFVEKTLEFSSFPATLLFLTILRLGLNIASTRLILSKGEAGSIIYTFGEFVIGSNVAIGLVIFSILTVVNFVVVTKGAGRIAEVAARFTLEALPGKQMLLDADLANGTLSKEEAAVKREQLGLEAEFYGQMDGASKFIKGDAIASVIIVLINLFGGFCFGLFNEGLSLQECLTTYTRLSIGDGLVTQLPALLSSIAAAILLTRVSNAPLGKTLLTQLTIYPPALLFSGVGLLILALIPGSPTLVLVPGALLLLWTGWKGKKEAPQEKEPKTAVYHPIVVELGKGHIKDAHFLFEKLPSLREEIAKKLGFEIPSISIRDNLSKESYSIKIKGITAYSGDGDLLEQVRETVIEGAHLLFTRQEVERLIEKTKSFDGLLVEQLKESVPAKDLLKIFRALLAEKVPIVDFPTIFEAIADHAGSDNASIVEKVRQRLSEHLTLGMKELNVITVDVKVEQMICASLRAGSANLRETTCRKIEKEVALLMERGTQSEIKPVLLTSANVRKALRDLLLAQKLTVFSYEEISPTLQLNILGAVSTDVLI